jgi:hypothetical protein
MTIRLSRRLAMRLGFGAAASAAGATITRADPPGYLFLDLDDNSASVVHPPRDQARARISKLPAKVSDEVATAIVEGAQPVSSSSVVLAYRGHLYIVPDKQLEGGKIASEMVTRAASRASD